MSITKNLFYNLSKSRENLYFRAKSLMMEYGIDTNNILKIVFAISLILFSVVSTLNTFSSSQQTVSIISSEKEKLELAKVENNKLQFDLDYFSSLEFQRRYAHDSLGLVRKGESLIVVESSDRAFFETEFENPSPIRKEQHPFWWETIYKLIFY